MSLTTMTHTGGLQPNISLDEYLGNVGPDKLRESLVELEAEVARRKQLIEQLEREAREPSGGALGDVLGKLDALTYGGHVGWISNTATGGTPIIPEPTGPEVYGRTSASAWEATLPLTGNKTITGPIKLIGKLTFDIPLNGMAIDTPDATVGSGRDGSSFYMLTGKGDDAGAGGRVDIKAGAGGDRGSGGGSAYLRGGDGGIGSTAGRGIVVGGSQMNPGMVGANAEVWGGYSSDSIGGYAVMQGGETDGTTINARSGDVVLITLDVNGDAQPGNIRFFMGQNSTTGAYSNLMIRGLPTTPMDVGLGQQYCMFSIWDNDSALCIGDSSMNPAIGGFLRKMGGGALTAGDITLFQDPTLPMHAVTKQYVDAASGSFIEPPDNKLYARFGGATPGWSPTVDEAPLDGAQYVRESGGWVTSTAGAITEPVGPGVWGRLETADWQRSVALTGDHMLGTLTFAAAPSIATRDSAVGSGNLIPDLLIKGGKGDSNARGGQIIIEGGAGGDTGPGGNVILNGGDSGLTGAPGQALMYGGAGLLPSQSGNNAEVHGGYSMDGIGGYANLIGGETRGTTASARSGDIVLLTPDTTGDAQPGNIRIFMGVNSTTGVPGNFMIRNLPTVPMDAGLGQQYSMYSIWDNDSVLCIGDDTMNPAIGGFLRVKGGGALTEGDITLFQDPTLPMHAVTKQYADALSAGGGAFLPLTGGTLTGPLTVTDSTLNPGLSIADVTGTKHGELSFGGQSGFFGLRTDNYEFLYFDNVNYTVDSGLRVRSATGFQITDPMVGYGASLSWWDGTVGIGIASPTDGRMVIGSANANGTVDSNDIWLDMTTAAVYFIKPVTVSSTLTLSGLPAADPGITGAVWRDPATGALFASA
jgi:hypothetical protein